LDVIVSTGSLLSRSLSERVRSRLGQDLISNYGSTEMSTVATAPAHLIAEIPGAVGYVTPGVRVEIVDASGRRLGPDQEGIIRISGDCQVDRYLGDPSASEQA